MNQHDELVVNRVTGKAIISVQIEESSGYSGVVRLTLDDGCVMSFAAWDDGGSPIGSLRLPDGEVVEFCGGG